MSKSRGHWQQPVQGEKLMSSATHITHVFVLPQLCKLEINKLHPGWVTRKEERDQVWTTWYAQYLFSTDDCAFPAAEAWGRVHISGFNWPRRGTSPLVLSLSIVLLTQQVYYSWKLLAQISFCLRLEIERISESVWERENRLYFREEPSAEKEWFTRFHWPQEHTLCHLRVCPASSPCLQWSLAFIRWVKFAARPEVALWKLKSNESQCGPKWSSNRS